PGPRDPPTGTGPPRPAAAVGPDRPAARSLPSAAIAGGPPRPSSPSSATGRPTAGPPARQRTSPDLPRCFGGIGLPSRPSDQEGSSIKSNWNAGTEKLIKMNGKSSFIDLSLQQLLVEKQVPGSSCLVVQRSQIGE